MGLLQQIRALNNSDVPKEVPFYSPVFLGIVNKRGYFFMDKQSLESEIGTCEKKIKKDFYDWLKENDLSIKETNLHFKIYRV